MKELSQIPTTFTAYSEVEQELTTRFNSALAIQKKVRKLSNLIDCALPNCNFEAMKTRNRLLVSLLVIAFTLASAATSQAVVVIYSVTFSAKARFFPRPSPRGNSILHRGYLIYDTANPGSSISVELSGRTRTYQVQGAMINNIAPSSIGFGVLDRNSDAFFETQAGQIGAGGVSRSYLGIIPRPGIRFGNSVPLTGLARVLRGVGAASGADHFRTNDVWRMHPLTAAGPVNTNAGLVLLQANLAGRRYTQVP